MVSCFGIGDVYSGVKQVIGAIALIFIVAFFSKWWWFQSYEIDANFWFVLYLSFTIFFIIWFVYFVGYMWWQCRKCRQRERAAAQAKLPLL